MTQTIVIGSGPNGLTAGSYLARAGHGVLVLDAADSAGGMCSGDEFHPGFVSPGLFADTTSVRPSVIAELDLEAHGLALSAKPPGVLAVGGGETLWIPGQVDAACEEIEKLNRHDKNRYREYCQFLARIRGVIENFVDEPPLDILAIENHRAWDLVKKAWRLRRLGRADMLQLLRIVPMCVADWLDEWFEHPLLKAALALPALSGNFVGPRSPGTNATLLLSECTRGPGSVGGGPALITALKACLKSHGGQLRTAAVVDEIAIEGGVVTGVRLDDGEFIAASTVVCTCDPKTALLELIAPRQLSSRLEHHAQAIRSRGTTAQVLLAVRGQNPFGPAGRSNIEHIRVAADLDTIERSFDAIKYRAVPETPVLEVWHASAALPNLCPDGTSVLSVRVHFVPHDVEGDWTDELRNTIAAAVVSQLDDAFPGLSEAIVGRRLLTPADVEARYRTSGGSLHHGELALDQILVRPLPEAVHYRTPIVGLFLGGAGSHPGGGLTCGPGRLCARTVLADSAAR